MLSLLYAWHSMSKSTYIIEIIHWLRVKGTIICSRTTWACDSAGLVLTGNPLQRQAWRINWLVQSHNKLLLLEILNFHNSFTGVIMYQWGFTPNGQTGYKARGQFRDPEKPSGTKQLWAVEKGGEMWFRNVSINLWKEITMTQTKPHSVSTPHAPSHLHACDGHDLLCICNADEYFSSEDPTIEKQVCVVGKCRGEWIL